MDALGRDAVAAADGAGAGEHGQPRTARWRRIAAALRARGRSC